MLCISGDFPHSGIRVVFMYSVRKLRWRFFRRRRWRKILHSFAFIWKLVYVSHCSAGTPRLLGGEYQLQLDFIPPTMESTSEPKQQPTGSKARPPSFANWPTLKILLPPTGKSINPYACFQLLTVFPGRASVETDEWCFTYCSQNVTGRFHSQDAQCSTICVRKVFPHEVQNILNFKRHRVDADGQVRYPLPPEGQSSNLPRYLGGSKGASGSKLSSDSDNEQPPPPAPQHWKTGWYMWSTNKQRSTVEHLMLMNSDLARSAANDQRRLKTRQEWQEYQEFLQRTGWDVNDGTPPPEGKYWGARRPSKPFYEEQDHLYVNISYWFVHLINIFLQQLNSPDSTSSTNTRNLRKDWQAPKTIERCIGAVQERYYIRYFH